MVHPVLESLNTPVWAFDIERRAMAWANRAAAALWGADDVASLLARDFASDMSRATAARLDEYTSRLAAGEVITEQWTFYPLNRGSVAVECRCSRTTLEDGRSAMLVEAGQQVLPAADLRGLEAVRHTGAAIGLYDEDGGMLYHNPTSYGLFGDERVRFVARFVDAALGQRVWAAAWKGLPVSGEAELETREGPRWFAYRLFRTRDPVSSAPAVLADQQEISLLVAAREARETAEATSEARAEFLAHMSHEIRTPMTAILGFTEELRDALGEARGAEVEMLGIIESSARRLRGLLDDALDLSRLEAGKLEVLAASTLLPEVLSRLQGLLQPTARAAGLELVFECAPELERPVLIDADRLEQILLNLVANALKFTPSGQVRLLVQVQGAQLHFHIEDTGIGMAHEHAAQVFEPFEQGRRATRRRFGGAGLGLAISRQLAEVMGGSLELEWTAPGVGTRFLLELPRAWAQTPPTATGDVGLLPLPEGTKVLVAEDNAVNARLIERVLARLGADVAVVGDGQAAIDYLEGGSGDAIELVLMDLHMPRVDGIDAVRKLRAAGLRTPIVALSASAHARDRHDAIEAGFDGFCAKPIDRIELAETLRALLA